MYKFMFLILSFSSIVIADNRCDSSSLYSLATKEYCIAGVKGKASGAVLGLMSTQGTWKKHSPAEADAFCKDHLNKALQSNEFAKEYGPIYLEVCANEFGYSYN